MIPVNDPLFMDQWYLQNSGQADGAIGVDLHVLPVWPNYDGAGIRVAVTDNGVQLEHPDLAANLDIASSYNGATDMQGGSAGAPVLQTDDHGTAVAGIIGAVANNGIGTAGIAYGATIVSDVILLGEDPQGDETPLSSLSIARAFQNELAENIDISNNSWGAPIAFSDNWSTPVEVERDGIVGFGSKGRHGLGGILVFSAGNSRGLNADAMLDNTLNSRFVITVGAVGNNGVASSYSTEGSDLLVSGFGGGNQPGQLPGVPGNAITTTDRTGLDGYYSAPSPAGDYTNDFNGTSAAAPTVSGVIALMLQANGGLGYRDVQGILAYSAQFNDASSAGWIATGAGNANGGGLHYSREYGFGLVDAHAAVRLAEVFNLTSVAHAESGLITSTGIPTAGGVPTGTKFSAQRSIALGFDFSAAQIADRVELKLDLTDADPSTLTVLLKSPDGTIITMVSNPGNTGGKAWPGLFTLGSPAFMGENAVGHWTAVIQDSGNGGIFNAAQLQVLGDAPPAGETYVFNDDFAKIASRDGSRLVNYGHQGTPDTLNAAAVSAGVTFDLSGNGASTVQGQSIAFASNAAFSQLIGGDGDDRLVGDGRGQLFLGGRGNNVIDGGVAKAGVQHGVSTAAYLDSREDYSVSSPLLGPITVSDQVGAAIGSDTVSNVGKMQFIEGTLYTPAAADTGISTAVYYVGLLGRAPEAFGYQHWTTTQSSPSGVGQGFLDSVEWRTGEALKSNAQFVTDLYARLLDREPEAYGFDAWTSRLQTGLTRVDVANGFASSTEFGGSHLKPLFTTINSLGNIWGI